MLTPNRFTHCRLDSCVRAKRLLTLLTLAMTIVTAGCLQLRSPGGESQQSTPQSPMAPSPAAPNQATTPCALTRPKGLVSDEANVLDKSTREELERKLQNLKTRGQIDFAVVTVSDTAGQDIFDYSLALANCWGVGSTNSDGAGVLLLIAVNDRKWRIQITRELEKILSNDDVFQIGNLMVPEFKNGNYSAGVRIAVDKMIDELAKRRNFSTSDG